MLRIRRLVEDLPIAHFYGASLVAVVAPSLGGVLAGGAWGIVGAALSFAVCVVVIVGFRWRIAAAALPLAIAEQAVVAPLDGFAAYRFRVVLGRGRPLRHPRASVTWVGADGPVALELLAAWVPVAVGAWTVVAVDRDGRCTGDGAFRVRVTALEGRRTWVVERAFPRDRVVQGRFAPPARLVDGRLALDVDAWDHIADDPPR